MIAAWANDDVKEGKPMANFRQFKEEMKSEELKADEDAYDYYVSCYNSACSSSKKKIKASTDSSSPESILKSIAEYLRDDGMGYSDDKTWAARITEEGGIEYITIDIIKKALSEDEEGYYSDDPVDVFFDCAELITNRKSAASFAKKHGFLDDFIDY